MKTKLLRKIRKRFGYYFRKHDGRPVLVDLKKKNHLSYNDETLYIYAGVKTEEEFQKKVEVDKDEYAWRCLKGVMYDAFGYSYSDVMFNYAKRAAQHIYKRYFQPVEKLES
jgi:hypothetical protein